MRRILPHDGTASLGPEAFANGHADCIPVSHGGNDAVTVHGLRDAAALVGPFRTV
jgi:hypothetical protein